MELSINYFKSGMRYKLSRLWLHLYIKPVNGRRWRNWKDKPEVIDGLSTLQLLVQNKLSICRFGDGEFNLIWGNDIGFQKNSHLLMRRLHEIMLSSNPKILIGLPDIFGALNGFRPDTAKWWIEYRLRNLSKFRQMLRGVSKVVDANITRFTTERSTGCPEMFISLFKQIWDGRSISIVEGEKSRLGVGNDLFANARSIERIITPAKQAFDIYDRLLDCCLSQIPQDNVVIIALGPTATVLAYDLAMAGYQALDLGHIDIQYEYYLRGITEKVPIPGKYVNEGGAIGQSPDDSVVDKAYLDSIKVKLTMWNM